MIIKMYCQQNAAQAGNQPGNVTRLVRFQVVPAIPANGTKAATPAPSADLFKGGEGGVVLELVNVTPEVAAQFEAGKCYDVTIG